MSQLYEGLKDCMKNVGERTDLKPEIAIVLGSGLGDYVEEMDISASIGYQEIKGFPVSTVAGHEGRFVFGYVNGVSVVVMQGRVHYYEGYSMNDVVLPIRLMRYMGARKLLLTNASGGINRDFKPGDFMMIRDHISCFVPSPLIGPNIDEMGPRFPDMSDIYRKRLRKTIGEAAAAEGIGLKEGVYLQLTGPGYESPAEVELCRILGADAVGMSTACEAAVANHMGMEVCGISCITNMACGISEKPLNHREVQETADRVAPLFKRLVTASITRMSEK